MDKQITLITGTSKGIGKALKEYYIAQNHFVIGCSRSIVENVEDKYKHYSIDITNEQEVIQMFKDIKTNYKKIVDVKQCSLFKILNCELNLMQLKST